jgi:hypothetical protein
MAERCITVFGTDEREIFAFARHKHGSLEVHGTELARAIIVGVETFRVYRDIPVNAGNLGAFVLARLVSGDPGGDFEIIHIDDVDDPGYDVIDVCVESGEDVGILITHVRPLGGNSKPTGVWTPEEFEEHCSSLAPKQGASE